MPNLNTEQTKLEEMKLISATDVARICTLSRSNLFEQEAAGTFPARVQISQSRFAYPEKEVSAWLHEKYRLREKWFPHLDNSLRGEVSPFNVTSDEQDAEFAAHIDAQIEEFEAEEKLESAEGGAI